MERTFEEDLSRFFSVEKKTTTKNKTGNQRVASSVRLGMGARSHLTKIDTQRQKTRKREGEEEEE